MGDLISRQKAIEEIYQLLKELPNKKNSALFKDGVRDGYARAIGRIRIMPSAQPRKGKWIEHDDNWANVYYECSVCKEPFVLIDGTPAENLYNFCPNCGCRMEEGDSDD